MTKPHAARLARNDESLNKADHHREPWSEDEMGFLLDWDRSDEELIIIAECLGRTIEACRQRFYQALRGEIQIHVVQTKTVTTVTETTATAQKYLGTNDDPDDQWWSPSNYTEGR